MLNSTTTTESRKQLTVKEFLALKKHFETQLLLMCDRKAIKSIEIVVDLTDEGMDQF